MRGAAVLLAAALALAAPVRAQDAAALARAASAQLAEAAGLLGEAESAPDRIEALTATVRAYERGLSAMREGLRRAALREREVETALAAEDREIASLLATLQSVSRKGGGERFLHPGDAADTIRAGILTASLVPALQERASGLERRLSEMHDLIAIQEAGIASLEQGAADIRTARKALVDTLAAREGGPREVSTDDAAIEALVNSAETLEAFADSLMPDEVRATWLGDGTWPMPVTGRVLRAYNEADAAGVRRPGWVVATEPRALVTTPVPATVRFAGEIPGQGIVTILEPGPGLLVILAGLDTSFLRREQIVAAGEPIGLMGGTPPPIQEKLNETDPDSGLFGGETLYMEIRQGRTAVDPAGVLRLGEE